MKFKTIFILFNIVLVFSFIFIFFMPFSLLGAEYSLTFWKANWPLALFFAAVLAAFNWFFALNWKLFSMVEKEDWEKLSAWLSARIFEGGRRDRRYLRLLVNASLLRSDADTIRRLEELLAADRPAALRRDALLFTVARSLRADPAGTEAFMAGFQGAKGVDNPAWLAFYRAFNLVLLKRAEEAMPILETGLASKDPVLSLLSAYLLGSVCAAAAPAGRREALVASAAAVKARLSSRYRPERWSMQTERAKNEVHVVVLSKLLDDAGAWLYAPAAAEAEPALM